MFKFIKKIRDTLKRIDEMNKAAYDDSIPERDSIICNDKFWDLKKAEVIFFEKFNDFSDRPCKRIIYMTKKHHFLEIVSSFDKIMKLYEMNEHEILRNCFDIDTANSRCCPVINRIKQAINVEEA